MGDTSPEFNPDLVYDLFWGIFKPQFTRLALQLDVFTPLAAGSTTAEQVAQSCHCDTLGENFVQTKAQNASLFHRIYSARRYATLRGAGKADR